MNIFCFSCFVWLENNSKKAFFGMENGSLQIYPNNRPQSKR